MSKVILTDPVEKSLKGKTSKKEETVFRRKQHCDATPLVSVIVPNYNHARYLDRRLQTVLNQTYPNFEVWILDDKSTDNSLEVIAKYKDNTHIAGIVVNDVNSGSPFKQWDKGIYLANGDIIWIAESDDYCELNLLEELVKAYLHKPNTVLAYNTTLEIDDEGNAWNTVRDWKNQYMGGKKYIKSYLTLFNYIKNASCAIFSKSVAQTIDKSYSTYKGAGDYLFWVEIAAQGNVAIVNKRLSYFCRHAGTVTNKRGLDGTNQKEEWQIYNHIRQLVRIGYFRNRLVCAHHANRIRNYQYANEHIREKLYGMWNCDKYTTHIDWFLIKAANHIVKRFNYYI